MSSLGNIKNCEKCVKRYTYLEYKWCKPCQINNLKNNFTNWTSGNEKIDNLIQGMQLKINYPKNIILEWIPYIQFSNINEIKKSDSATVYSAIWNNGPLNYDDSNKYEYIRSQYTKVNLKCLHNSQNITDEFLDEVESYLIDHNRYYNNNKIYGISQDSDTNNFIIVFLNGYYCEKCGKKYTNIKYKWCKPCQINNLKNNFTIWTSGNKKIDNLIQETQLKIDHPYKMGLEWIPYNQFSNINEIKKIDSTTVYSAIWKDGPLNYDSNKYEYIRSQNTKVNLKCLHNSQNIINEFLNEVESCLINHNRYNNNKIYGISQDSDTNNFIIVFLNGYYCEKCGKKYTNIRYKWCEPCQINNLKNNFTIWTSGNKKIDNLIQEMQLKIDHPCKIVLEWIPYNQFSNINEIKKNDSTTVHSAMWKDGPLNYDSNKYEYIRSQNTKVYLKCLHNSQNMINEFLNEVESYLISNDDDDDDDDDKIYGISQDSDTNNFIIVFLLNEYCEKCGEKYTNIECKWCKPCQINNLKNNFTSWTSGNENIDNLIQEMQLKIDSYKDIIFEWIPFSQFNIIKEIGKGGITTVYLAIWKDGPLYYSNNKYRYTRKYQNKEITLKFLHNSQNITNELLNKYCDYGISQDPDTNNFIVVSSNNKYCEKCGKEYEYASNWCKPCQINNLKNNFTNWTSGNEKIDNLIQGMQLKINYSWDIVLEWIPYNQLSNINEIKNSDFVIYYSAIWKVGPLNFDSSNKYKYTRSQNTKVDLKCLHNSQNITNEFLDEVKSYLINGKIYGISQDPDTNNFVIVFLNEYCENCGVKYTNIEYKWCKLCQINYLKDNLTKWTSGNENIDNLIQEMQLKIDSYEDIIFEWIPFSQFNIIKEIGKGGFATVYLAIWDDGPLYYSNNKYRYTRKYQSKEIALKFLHNSQNITSEFLNEVKKYSIIFDTDDFYQNDNIIKIYGISQNPDTKDYIMVLDYAEGDLLFGVIKGLKAIHQKHLVHCDFHAGNILLNTNYIYDVRFHTYIFISDMGLCKEVHDVNQSNIYGVIPYVAPEVLKGKPYTQAADIYSFGMIMYFIATGGQPFANCAHDEILVLNICDGIRPEIKEPVAPKCYIDLMKRCWDPNPDNRPKATECYELINSFRHARFSEAEKYRRLNISSSKKNRQSTHAQAIYTSRLLNPFTKNLPRYDNIDNNSIEVTDFTKLTDE
uniref:Protein kinase domain-containing protein n=3 Tax=Rhizophagus irregularis TaxID=588596 RepID=U9U181_RHIID